MKYIGSKEKDIEYRKRPGAYAIIINKNDDKVGIVTNGAEYFYLGGGIEKGETERHRLSGTVFFCIPVHVSPNTFPVEYTAFR